MTLTWCRIVVQNVVQFYHQHAARATGICSNVGDINGVISIVNSYDEVAAGVK
jgi:hypothetical protein